MIKPLGQNVVLEKEEIKETVVNGIYLQENTKQKSNIGKVIAIGDDVKKECNIELDNYVLYREYAGTEVEHHNKNLILIEAKDILAIIED